MESMHCPYSHYSHYHYFYRHMISIKYWMVMVMSGFLTVLYVVDNMAGVKWFLKYGTRHVHWRRPFKSHRGRYGAVVFRAGRSLKFVSFRPKINKSCNNTVDAYDWRMWARLKIGILPPTRIQTGDTLSTISTERFNKLQGSTFNKRFYVVAIWYYILKSLTDLGLKWNRPTSVH